MKRTTARKILKLNKTEKYFIDTDHALLKVEADNTMAFIKFYRNGRWINPDINNKTFWFDEMYFENTEGLKPISKEEAFEILL